MSTVGTLSSNTSRISIRHTCERNSPHNESDTSKIPACTAASFSSSHQVMRESLNSGSQ